MNESELRLTCPAQPDVAKRMRHALAAFLDVLRVDSETSDDVLTAIGEALANAIEHAYEGEPAPGLIGLTAALQDADLLIDVVDRGNFIERDLRVDRGFGLRIIRSIARTVDIKIEDGTRIHMVFDVG